MAAMSQGSGMGRHWRGIFFKPWSTKRRDAAWDLLGLILLLTGAGFMFLVAIPEILSYRMLGSDGAVLLGPDRAALLAPPDPTQVAEHDRYLLRAVPAMILIFIGTVLQGRRPWREFREG